MAGDKRLRSDQRQNLDAGRAGREDSPDARLPIEAERTTEDDARLELFRSQFMNDQLPNLPPIPGYHVIWLTTTNPRDSIQMRMRLGYTPIVPADIPGYPAEHATVKTGEHAGFIGVNEMIAFKLPLHLYERYMQEAHHYAPLREDQKLTAVTDGLREEARRKGADLIEGEGQAELRRAEPRPPSFLSEEEARSL